MLRLVPVRRELIWGPDDDRVTFKRERFRRLQPGPKRLFRKLTAGAVENARPYFVRRERHDDVDNSGEAGVAKLSEPCGKSKRLHCWRNDAQCVGAVAQTLDVG